MAGNTSEPGVGHAERIFRLLSAFDAGYRRLSLTQVTQRTGLPKATCHRMLQDLLRLGVLQQAGRGRYAIGPVLWKLGLLSPVEQDLRRVALPYMQDLLTATRQIVNLFTLDGHRALLLERISGSAVGDPIASPGDRLPLRTSAAGKVLLAFSDDPAEEVLGGGPITPTLREELERVRRQGWATTAEELATGAWGLAVPVPHRQGHAPAALGVVALTPFRDPTRVAPALKVTAAAIARAFLRHEPDTD